MAGIRVAIVPSHGLGDGLIQLVLANNLRLNGDDVVYFHDYLSTLAHCAEGIDIRPVPDEQSAIDELRSAHVVMYDGGSRFAGSLSTETAAWLIAHGICYSMTHARPSRPSIPADMLRRRLPAEYHHRAETLVRLGRSLRDGGLRLPRKPVARQLADNVGRLLRLETRTRSNGLKLAVSETALRTSRVVAIHPTSSHPRKNWGAERFVQLAHRLGEDGWHPAFTVAPDERLHWLHIGGGIDVPLFESIRELADYYRQAAAFVGNDSGNAHLASCIGLPNVVIHRHCRTDAPWRPAWTEPRVVASRSMSRNHWQKSVSVERVYRHFNQSVGRRGPSVRFRQPGEIDAIRP